MLTVQRMAEASADWGPDPTRKEVLAGRPRRHRPGRHPGALGAPAGPGRPPGGAARHHGPVADDPPRQLRPHQLHAGGAAGRQAGGRPSRPDRRPRQLPRPRGRPPGVARALPSDTPSGIGGRSVRPTEGPTERMLRPQHLGPDRPPGRRDARPRDGGRRDRPAHDLRRLPRPVRAGGGRPGRAGRRRRHRGVVGAAHHPGGHGAVRRPAAAGRGAEPDPAHLPRPRGGLHRPPGGHRRAGHAIDVAGLRLPGHGRPGGRRHRRRVWW